MRPQGSSGLVAYPEFEITEFPRGVVAASGTETSAAWDHVVAEMARLERRCAELLDDLTRAHASDRAGRRAIVLALIEDVKDNLDRSLEGVGEDQLGSEASRWFKRLRRTQRAIAQLLAAVRVVPVDFEQFASHVMVIGGVRQRDDVSPGTVLEVVRAGYLCEGEVLRKAEVIVAATAEGSAGVPE